MNIAQALTHYIHERERIDRAATLLRATAERLVAREITNGAASYRRERDLPKLFPEWCWSHLSDAEIRDMLAVAIRGTAKGVAAGHWAADSNRLMALRMALAGEERRG